MSDRRDDRRQRNRDAAVPAEREGGPHGAHPRPDVDLALRSSRRVPEPGEAFSVATRLSGMHVFAMAVGVSK